MAEQNRDKYAYLDQLSTRRLEALLLADAEDTSDRDTSEAVSHILEVLQKREDSLITDTADADKAWAEFQACYNIPEGKGQALYPCEEDRAVHREKVASTEKPRKRSIPWKLAGTIAATIALVFALMIGAQASGMDVFGALAQWTSETLHFGVRKSSIQSENYELFLNELSEYDIQKELAPTWCPTGFAASEPQTRDGDSNVSIQISFTNSDEKTFFISISRYTSTEFLNDRRFEKNDPSAEAYTSQGKTFYIFSNTDSISATWADGALSESIWGDLSVDEVKLIIDSIGGS